MYIMRFLINVLTLKGGIQIEFNKVDKIKRFKIFSLISIFDNNNQDSNPQTGGKRHLNDPPMLSNHV